MKKIWPLVALGISAFCLFALVTLPAGVVVSRLAGSGVTASGVSGTVWKGQAQVLQVGGMNVGSVTWDLHVLPLLTGRASAAVKVTRTDGFAQTTVTVAPSRRLDFEELTASLPLSSLPAGAVPGGWTGTMNVKLATLSIEQGWPVQASGTIEALDLTGPANNPVNRGSYKVSFPAEGAAADTLTGALTDIGGPLQVAGKVQLRRDRSYVVDGLVATRPEAPRDLVNALQILGQPDAEGRRPFSLEGTI